MGQWFCVGSIGLWLWFTKPTHVNLPSIPSFVSTREGSTTPGHSEMRSRALPTIRTLYADFVRLLTCPPRLPASIASCEPAFHRCTLGFFRAFSPPRLDASRRASSSITAKPCALPFLPGILCTPFNTDNFLQQSNGYDRR